MVAGCWYVISALTFDSSALKHRDGRYIYILLMQLLQMLDWRKPLQGRVVATRTARDPGPLGLVGLSALLP